MPHLVISRDKIRMKEFLYDLHPTEYRIFHYGFPPSPSPSLSLPVFVLLLLLPLYLPARLLLPHSPISFFCLLHHHDTAPSRLESPNASRADRHGFESCPSHLSCGFGQVNWSFLCLNLLLSRMGQMIIGTGNNGIDNNDDRYTGNVNTCHFLLARASTPASSCWCLSLRMVTCHPTSFRTQEGGAVVASHCILPGSRGCNISHNKEASLLV